MILFLYAVVAFKFSTPLLIAAERVEELRGRCFRAQCFQIYFAVLQTLESSALVLQQLSTRHSGERGGAETCEHRMYVVSISFFASNGGPTAAAVCRS